MENPQNNSSRIPADEVIKNLSGIRNTLVKLCANHGGTPGYFAMRRQIETLGWGGILQKYHPDVNVENPYAMELFELYRFVWKTMNK